MVWHQNHRISWVERDIQGSQPVGQQRQTGNKALFLLYKAKSSSKVIESFKRVPLFICGYAYTSHFMVLYKRSTYIILFI